MISEEQLIEAIRQVAATEPDFVYDNEDGDGGGITGCQYASNARNACGCIVGEALKLLGVSEDRLRTLDLLGQANPVAWTAGAVIDELSDLLEGAALRSNWVRVVQRKQDEGQAWADAVVEADALYGRSV